MRCWLLILFALNLAAAEGAGETVAYEHDGTALSGYLALPAEIPDEGAPGVLVVHEWWGHNAYARRRADELAAAGYAAFALDMYGSEPVTTADEAKALAGPFYQERALMRSRAQAGLDQLRNRDEVDGDRLAAIGFCFGGTVALELARGGESLDAVVAFHGGLETPQPAEAGTYLPAILVCHGAADPMVPPSQLAGFMEEMNAAGADYRVIAYGGAVHAFTNPAADDDGLDGTAHDPEAEAAAFAAMHRLFEELWGQ